MRRSKVERTRLIALRAGGQLTDHHPRYVLHPWSPEATKLLRRRDQVMRQCRQSVMTLGAVKSGLTPAMPHFAGRRRKMTPLGRAIRLLTARIVRLEDLASQDVQVPASAKDGFSAEGHQTF